MSWQHGAWQRRTGSHSQSSEQISPTALCAGGGDGGGGNGEGTGGNGDGGGGGRVGMAGGALGGRGRVGKGGDGGVCGGCVGGGGGSTIRNECDVVFPMSHSMTSEAFTSHDAMPAR